MVPKFAARVAEQAVFGREGTTLGTSPEITQAGQMAQYLVMHSSTNPAAFGMLIEAQGGTRETAYTSRGPVCPSVHSLAVQ